MVQDASITVWMRTRSAIKAWGVVWNQPHTVCSWQPNTSWISRFPTKNTIIPKKHICCHQETIFWGLFYFRNHFQAELNPCSLPVSEIRDFDRKPSIFDRNWSFACSFREELDWSKSLSTVGFWFMRLWDLLLDYTNRFSSIYWPQNHKMVHLKSVNCIH